MLKDLPKNKVEDVAIAIVLDSETAELRLWKVYLLNLKEIPLSTVFVSSKGYGTLNGEQIKTSVLRHSVGDVAAKKFKAIELLDEKLFGINNEFLLSFYIDSVLYDKKFIFLPESITESNFIRIPMVNKPGVMIK